MPAADILGLPILGTRWDRCPRPSFCVPSDWPHLWIGPRLAPNRSNSARSERWLVSPGEGSPAGDSDATTRTSRDTAVLADLLSQVPALKALDDIARVEVAEKMESILYADGEAVITEGEVGEKFFVVSSRFRIVHRAWARSSRSRDRLMSDRLTKNRQA